MSIFTPHKGRSSFVHSCGTYVRTTIIGTLLLFVLSFFSSQSAIAQLNCCKVNSLTINTGYSPITSTTVAATAPDPKWTVSEISPDMYTAIGGSTASTIGGPAYIVPTFTGWWVSSPVSGWISCVNSMSVTTTASSTYDYHMKLSRTFKLCSPSAVKIDLNVADDNWISSIDIDGVSFFSQTAGGAYYGGFVTVPTYTTGILSSGPHTINVKVYEDNNGGFNPAGVNIKGTVATTPSSNISIISESPSCTNYSCLGTIGSTNVICKGSNATLTCSPAGGVWSSSSSAVASINSSTGVMTGASTSTSPATATITYTAGGCYTTYPVTVNPQPVVTPTYSLTPVCEGGTLSLFAGASGCTGCTYSWTGPASFTSAVMNPTRNPTTAAMTGNYVVNVTNTYGCSKQGTVAVTVRPTPTVTATTNTPCEGSTLTLSGTVLSCSGCTYSWAGPGGFTSATLATNRTPATLAMSGVYSLTVTSMYGCVSTMSTVNVTVKPLPVITATASPNVLCAGDYTTLNAAVAYSGTGTLTYSWAGSGTCPTCSTTVSHPGASYVYTVTVTGNGCPTVANVSVTVNPAPVFTATATFTPTTACEGTTLDLSTTAPACSGCTYLWSGPAGYTSTDMASTITPVTMANSGVYTLTATNAFGCVVTHTITATVHPLPVVAAYVTMAPSFCEPNPLVLHNGGGTCTGCTYSWAGPGGYTSALANPTRTPSNTSMSGTYTVTITTSFGCQSTGTASVTVNPLPTVAAGYTWSPSSCAGSTLNLSSTVTACAGCTYSWSGPASFTSTDANPARGPVTTAMSGNYSVTVTNSSGCTATGTTSVTVTAIPVFTPTVAATPHCEGGTLSLLWNAPSGALATGYTYSWAGPGGYTSAVANPVITGLTLANSGVYSITATNSAGCSITNTINIVVNPTPVVTASAAPPVICLGSTTTLTGGVTYSGTATPTVAWTPAATVSCSTCTTTTATPTAAGVITYTFKATALGCISAPATAIVTVMTVPATPTVTVSAINVCVGGAITLTGSTPAAGTTLAWSISPAGLASLSSTTTNPTTLTGIAPGNVTITYKLTNMCGSSSSTKVVTVRPLPVPVINGKGQEMCVGGGLGFGGAAPGGTWSISPVTVATVTATGGVVTGVGPGTATLSYTLTSAYGCVGSATVVITVNPTPVVTITTMPGATTPTTPGDPAIVIAACGSADLTASSSVPATFSWAPATGLSATAGSTVTASPLVPTVYTVTATTASGCTGTEIIEVFPTDNGCVCDYQNNGMLFAPWGYSASGPAMMSTAPVPGNYLITNDIHITASMGIGNCVFLIASGVTITVDPGVTLTLKHCHLFTCNPDMWKGIDVAPKGSLELIQNTLIEDAMVAVNYDNAITPAGYVAGSGGPLLLNADGASFNKNGIGIRVNNYTPYITPALVSGDPTPLTSCYPFVISNTVFTSRKLYGYTTAPGSYPASWPFSWPNTTGSPDAFKNSWVSGSPYQPPYAIDNPAAYTYGGYPVSGANQPVGAQMGIYLEDVGTTTGATTTASYAGMVTGAMPGTNNDELDMFDNLQYGILAENSNLVVRNSVFMHMNGANYSSGNAIYTEHTLDAAHVDNLYKLWIYGSPANGSSFYDCGLGLESYDYYHIKAEYATLSSAHSTANLGDPQGVYGFYMASSNYFDIQVNHNYMVNVTDAIHFDAYGPATSTHPLQGQVAINKNKILASYSGVPTLNEYVSNAITAICTAPGYSVFTGSQVNTDNNTIDHVFNGIQVGGFDYNTLRTVTTVQNSIVLSADLVTGNQYGAAQYGIYEYRNSPSYIKDNNVSGPGCAMPVPTGYSGANYGLPVMEGVRVEKISNSYVECNTVNNINTGFYFGGTNGVQWINNTMNKNAYGYVLDGVIGWQLMGGPGGYNTCGNQWLPAGHYSYGTRNYQTYILNGMDPNLSSLFVDPANDPTVNWADAPYNASTSNLYGFGSSGMFNGLYVKPLMPAACVAPPASTVLFRNAGNALVDASADNVIAKEHKAYSLYPNPSNGSFYITQSASEESVVNVKVINLAGATAFNSMVSFNDGIASVKLDNPVPGMYLVQITGSNAEVKTFKVLIQK